MKGKFPFKINHYASKTITVGRHHVSEAMGISVMLLIILAGLLYLGIKAKSMILICLSSIAGLAILGSLLFDLYHVFKDWLTEDDDVLDEK